MATRKEKSKRISYPIAFTTIFTSLSLVATSAHAETGLAAADWILGGGSLVIIVVLVVLAIEWFFLPFAIFGTKDKLNQMIQATRKTNSLLEEILEEMVRSDLNPMGEQSIRAPRRPHGSRWE